MTHRFHDLPGTDAALRRVLVPTIRVDMSVAVDPADDAEYCDSSTDDHLSLSDLPDDE